MLSDGTVGPPVKTCPQCGAQFQPWRSRWSADGLVTCCSTTCRRKWFGKQQLVNGSHARACQTRRLRCAERMAQRLKGLTLKQAYQLGWKRGYQRGLGLVEQREQHCGETAVQKTGRIQ